MTLTTKINNVNLDAVKALAERIVEDPDSAQTVWRAEVRWNRAFRSEAKIRDFDPIPSDEPPALGGDDTAPNPVEQVLGALGNSLVVGYAANAATKGITINDLRIELEGDLDLHAFLGLRPGNAGYESIRVRTYLDTNASEDELQELHRTVISTSPVGHTLSRALPLEIELGNYTKETQ